MNEPRGGARLPARFGRASPERTLTINPCQLRYVYQGMDPSAGGEYITLPWRMGLLTQTNSPC